VRYRIEARVTDAGNREISGTNAVIATYGTFQVGISADSYVYQKDETINATAVAKDYEGTPDPGGRACGASALALVWLRE